MNPPSGELAEIKHVVEVEIFISGISYSLMRTCTSPEGIIQNGMKVGYYKDEEDPAKYWPEYALRGEV